MELAVRADGSRTEAFRFVSPLDEMSLEAALATMRVPADGVEVFVPSDGGFVDIGACVLLEEFEASSSPQGAQGRDARRRGAWRVRGHRGFGSIIGFVKSIAPRYVRRRWEETADDDDDGVTRCALCTRSGQLCVQWFAASGYRGSFQKPFRATVEVFAEVQGAAREGFMLKPGMPILLRIPGDPPGQALGSRSRITGKPVDVEHPDGAGDEDGRSVNIANCGSSEASADAPLAAPDVFDAWEVVVVLPARAAEGGCPPPPELTLREDYHRTVFFSSGEIADAVARDVLHVLGAPPGFHATPSQTVSSAADSPEEDDVPEGRFGRLLSQLFGPADEQRPPRAPPGAAARTAEAADQPSYHLEGMTLHVRFPGARSASDLWLAVSRTLVRVSSALPEDPRVLDVTLPRPVVDASSVRAHWSRARETLVVDLGD